MNEKTAEASIEIEIKKGDSMKKTIFCVFFSLLCFAAWANNDLFKTEEEFSSFCRSYYLNPHLEKVIPSLNYYTNSESYKKINARMAIAHFYVSILKDTPQILDDLFEDQTKTDTENSKIFTLTILWLIDNDQSKNLLLEAKKLWNENTVQEISSKIMNTKSYNALGVTLGDPAELDNLWGIFFASGSKEAVKKIISVLYLKKEGYGLEIILGGAAYWSLVNNGREHPRVFKIIKREIRKSSKITRQLLKEIVREIKKK